MICETCKFANWDLTATGRKHPSGRGQCTWTGTLRVAGSVWLGGYGKPYTVHGGTIWRRKGDEHPTRCDVYQKLGTK